MTAAKDPTGGVIKLLNREIAVAPITALGVDRMRLLARVYKRMANGEVGVDEFLKLDRLFSMLVSKEDDMWLEDQILEGTLTQDQVINAIVSAILVKKDEDTKPAPKKRATRARRT